MFNTLKTMFVAQHRASHPPTWTSEVLEVAAASCNAFGAIFFLCFMGSVVFIPKFSAVSVFLFLSFWMASFLLPTGFLLRCAANRNSDRRHFMLLTAIAAAIFGVWYWTVGTAGFELISRLLDDTLRKAMDFSCLLPTSWSKLGDFWPAR